MIAAILSLPTFIGENTPFPYKDLLILLVVGVVLCSLLLSSLVLPLILPGLKRFIVKSPAEEESQLKHGLID